MKIGDLVKHLIDGEIGLIVECEGIFGLWAYKVSWPKWSTTGWYTPDRLVPLKKS